ncbi:MAG: hypothetical protein P8M18_04650 [Woeseiaceae bacterium]|nr:hypothetical protein [Woeseiaceae bacterium]
MTKMQARNCLIVLTLLLQPISGLTQGSSQHPQIDQALGVDERVDYVSLVKFGPWDDRNYMLTLDDLSYLSETEDQIKDPIPAFFRIELRKKMPNLPKTGPAQYPRSAVQLFQIRYGGLLQKLKTLSPNKNE